MRRLPGQKDNRTLGSVEHDRPLGGREQARDHRFDLAARPGGRIEIRRGPPLAVAEFSAPNFFNQGVAEVAFVAGQAFKSIIVREGPTQDVRFPGREKVRNLSLDPGGLALIVGAGAQGMNPESLSQATAVMIWSNGTVTGSLLGEWANWASFRSMRSRNGPFAQGRS